jgi:type IV pilus assembly protein PilA
MDFVSKLRERMAKEESGFTLIELLVVIIILGILLAIAVPSYMGFKDRAEKKAAAANVRAALPSAEAYYSDNGTYATMTSATLKLIDQGISPTLVVTGTATTYCISDKQGTHYAKVTGPGGTVDDSATAGC